MSINFNYLIIKDFSWFQLIWFYTYRAVLHKFSLRNLFILHALRFHRDDRFFYTRCKFQNFHTLWTFKILREFFTLLWFAYLFVCLRIPQLNLKISFANDNLRIIFLYSFHSISSKLKLQLYFKKIRIMFWKNYWNYINNNFLL